MGDLVQTFLILYPLGLIGMIGLWAMCAVDTDGKRAPLTRRAALCIAFCALFSPIPLVLFLIVWLVELPDSKGWWSRPVRARKIPSAPSWPLVIVSGSVGGAVNWWFDASAPGFFVFVLLIVIAGLSRLPATARGTSR